MPGKGIWWKYDELRGEVDSDAEHDTQSEGPTLQHFRSSDFKKEEEYLSQCWEECMQQKVPAHFFYKADANGKVTQVTTNYLEEGIDGDQQLIEDREEGEPGNHEEIFDEDQDTVIEMSLVQDQVPDLGGDEIVDQRNGWDKPHADMFWNHTQYPKPKRAHSSPQCVFNKLGNSWTNQSPEMDIRTVPISPNNHQVSTRLGKAVEIVLGSTTEVQMFDAARSNLKKSPKSKYAIEQYKKKLAVIQTRVLAQKRGLTKLLKDWEKEFFLNHDCRMATVNEMKGFQVAESTEIHWWPTQRMENQVLECSRV